MKRLIFLLVLRPMILMNYWLRARHIIRDAWFWADLLAFTWGYTVTLRKTDRTRWVYLNPRCIKDKTILL